MEIIYTKDYLNKFNYANYYGIYNNKYIIKFVRNNDNKALLIFNNFDNSIKLDRKIFIIINNEIKDEFYYKLFLLKYNDIIALSNKNENIILFEEYINIDESSFTKENKINKKNSKDHFIAEISKLIISIYYYEQSLSKHLKNIFSDKNEIYYLINPIWLVQFKNYCNYQNIYQLLEQKPIDSDENYHKISHLEDEIFTETYLREYSFEKNNFFEILTNINILKFPIDNKFGISFFSECIIFPSYIFNSFKNIFFLNKNMPNMPIRILNKEKDLFMLFN